MVRGPMESRWAKLGLSVLFCALGACGDDAGGNTWLGTHGDSALSFRVDDADRLVEFRIAVTGGVCGNGSRFDLLAPGPISVAGDGSFEVTVAVDDVTRAGCGGDGSCAAAVLRGKLGAASAEGTLALTAFHLGGPPCLVRSSETWQARRGSLRVDAGAPSPDAQPPTELPGFTVGGALHEEALRVRSTDDGGLILAGHRFTGADPATADAYAVKLTAAGEVEWERSGMRDGPDVFADVLVLPDGYLFAGHSSLTPTAVREPYLMRTDARGRVMWNNVYRTDQPAWLSTVHLAPGGGFVAFGTRQNGPGRETAQVLIFQVAADGNAPIGLELGVAGGYDSLVDAVVTRDGGFALTGTAPAATGGGQSAFLARLDGSYGLTWVARFGGPLDDVGNAVIELPEGGFLVAGTWPLSTTDEQAFLARIEADGQLAWQRLFGGPGIERGYGVAKTAEGYLVCGVTFARGTADIYLVRTEGPTSPQREDIWGGAGFDGCWQMAGGVLAGSTASRGAGGFDMHALRL